MEFSWSDNLLYKYNGEIYILSLGIFLYKVHSHTRTQNSGGEKDNFFGSCSQTHKLEETHWSKEVDQVKNECAHANRHMHFNVKSETVNSEVTIRYTVTNGETVMLYQP